MYVDGFVLPVPKDKLDAYKELATVASQVWKDHGALSYVECVADDVAYGEVTSFPRSVQLTEDEVVVLAWITYPSKEVRDACNAKVMSDPRIKCDPNDMPFDAKRMFWGGFTPLVEA
ncbi:DUF1428 domain-containing protein [Niveispirillum sp. KHB5.9]|uniref:DUF1428 domain-containing protein n=1 Tax=Niveispirillum sp. KHB5.9 TaxID=3400269 RepID=UPI003A8729E4